MTFLTVLTLFLELSEGDSARLDGQVVVLDNAISECAEVRIEVERKGRHTLDLALEVPFLKITADCGCMSSLVRLEIDRRDRRGRMKTVMRRVFGYFKYAHEPYRVRRQVNVRSARLPLEVSLGCGPH